MKRILAFTAASAAVLLLAAWVSIALAGPETARAVWTSAALAFAVQIPAFGLVWRFREKNPIAGWGLGSLLRFAVLLVYAFVGAGALGLPLGPALLSLAGFLFVTMLLEPLFLR